MTSATTFNLWPVPSPPPSSFSPTRLAGSTPESTQTLLDVLKTNHEKWHVFFDELGRHNHISHHVIAVWALGAHADIVRAGYDKSESLMRPRGTTLTNITRENWKEFLGDKKYYASYLDFFTDVIEEIGPENAVREFIFARTANFASGAEKNPVMLSRLLDAIMHALIHIGYGAEFGLPGMVIEGLAETAVSRDSSSQILPLSWFDTAKSKSEYSSPAGSAASRLNSIRSILTHSDIPASNIGIQKVTAFIIVARVISDASIEQGAMGLGKMYPSVRDACGDRIRQYVDQWDIPAERIQEKIEELQWVMTLFYCVPGFVKGKEFNADFIAMHFVTTGIFLPSLITYLDYSEQILLLKSYLTTALVWYTALGKPSLNIRYFMEGTSPTPGPLGPQPEPSRFALPSPSSPVAKNPNPWIYLIKEAIAHPDDHVPKCQRALMHYAMLYGSRPKGYFGSGENGLDNLEDLDGTLFVRAAGLTQQRLGREFKSVPKLSIYWDRRGFGAGMEEGEDRY